MLAPKHNFNIGSHNVKGLHNKNECKIDDITKELVNDIEILSETWGCGCEKHFDGYVIIAQSEPVKHAGIKAGRKSGGIIVLCREGLRNQIKVRKISKNFVWSEISKEVVENMEKNLMLVSAYIHDVTSSYFDQNVFDELSLGISEFCNDNTPLLIMGDLNSRTSTEDENFSDPQIDLPCRVDINGSEITLPERANCDTNLNAHGKNILDICRISNLMILNGRTPSDPLGAFTYCEPNI